MKNWKLITGIIVIIIGVLLIIYGEYNNSKNSKLLDEVQAKVVHIDNIDKINPENENKLIHFNGITATDEIIKDSVFDINFKAIYYSRVIQYYQYEETKVTHESTDKNGNRIKEYDYEYDQKWVDEPIDSKNFQKYQYRNDNHHYFRITNNKLFAKNVHAGAFKLEEDQLKKLLSNDIADFEYDNKHLEEVRSQIKPFFGEKVHVESHNGKIFMGNGTYKRPKIGDMLASFVSSPLTHITVIAVQSGETLVPYTSDKQSFIYIKKGRHSIDEVIKELKDDSLSTAWAGRIAGVVFILIGGLLITFNKF